MANDASPKPKSEKRKPVIPAFECTLLVRDGDELVEVGKLSNSVGFDYWRIAPEVMKMLRQKRS